MDQELQQGFLVPISRSNSESSSMDISGEKVQQRWEGLLADVSSFLGGADLDFPSIVDEVYSLRDFGSEYGNTSEYGSLSGCLTPGASSDGQCLSGSFEIDISEHLQSSSLSQSSSPSSKSCQLIGSADQSWPRGTDRNSGFPSVNPTPSIPTVPVQSVNAAGEYSCAPGWPVGLPTLRISSLETKNGLQIASRPATAPAASTARGAGSMPQLADPGSLSASTSPTYDRGPKQNASSRTAASSAQAEERTVNGADSEALGTGEDGRGGVMTSSQEGDVAAGEQVKQGRAEVEVLDLEEPRAVNPVKGGKGREQEESEGKGEAREEHEDEALLCDDDMSAADGSSLVGTGDDGFSIEESEWDEWEEEEEEEVRSNHSSRSGSSISSAGRRWQQRGGEGSWKGNHSAGKTSRSRPGSSGGTSHTSASSHRLSPPLSVPIGCCPVVGSRSSPRAPNGVRVLPPFASEDAVSTQQASSPSARLTPVSPRPASQAQGANGSRAGEGSGVGAVKEQEAVGRTERREHVEGREDDDASWSPPGSPTAALSSGMSYYFCGLPAGCKGMSLLGGKGGRAGQRKSPCAACGRRVGRRPAVCIYCSTVVYCDYRCQSRHVNEHKRMCQGMDGRQTAGSPAAPLSPLPNSGKPFVSSPTSFDRPIHSVPLPSTGRNSLSTETECSSPSSSLVGSFSFLTTGSSFKGRDSVGGNATETEGEREEVVAGGGQAAAAATEGEQEEECTTVQPKHRRRNFSAFTSRSAKQMSSQRLKPLKLPYSRLPEASSGRKRRSEKALSSGRQAGISSISDRGMGSGSRASAQGDANLTAAPSVLATVGAAAVPVAGSTEAAAAPISVPFRDPLAAASAATPFDAREERPLASHPLPPLPPKVHVNKGLPPRHPPPSLPADTSTPYICIGAA